MTDGYEIRQAAVCLLRGDVVVLPTETVYGLAADATNEQAVRKIFQIKNRPFNDPLILHVASYEWLTRYINLNGFRTRAEKIANAFWPGPVTMILPKKSTIPDIVSAGLPTVAVRCPNHKIFQEVLKLTNTPLAAPSANPFGYVSPTTAQQVEQTIGTLVAMVIDAGPCDIGVESTIVDLTSKQPKILRPGALTAEEMADVLIAMKMAQHSMDINSEDITKWYEAKMQRNMGRK